MPVTDADELGGLRLCEPEILAVAGEAVERFDGIGGYDAHASTPSRCVALGRPIHKGEAVGRPELQEGSPWAVKPDNSANHVAGGNPLQASC